MTASIYLSRRDLIRGAMAGEAMAMTQPDSQRAFVQTGPHPLRLSRSVHERIKHPGQWDRAQKQLGEIPVMLKHLPSAQASGLAAQPFRSAAPTKGMTLV